MSERRVVIADYGVGNLLSAQRAFAHCGGEVVLTGDPRAVAEADRLVLPGVGAFAHCVRALETYGLIEPVKSFVASGRPMIGICVGMQMLFEGSEEFGRHLGLGFLTGWIKRIPDTDASGTEHKIPHIGWNALSLPEETNGDRWSETILNGVTPGTEVYFVHSYTAWPENAQHRLADVEYGGRRISAAVQKDNIFGTQFHPEKSGPAGLRIIDSFLKL
jgi:glutamine amidotransferase